MSLQQIVREFPFLKFYTNLNAQEFWQGAIINVRVSRLSLEALELTMEDIRDESFMIIRSLYVLDGKGGNNVYCREPIGMTFATIGDALLYAFPIRDKEWTEEVSYIMYITDHDTVKIRHHMGSKKARRVYKADHREIVLFKMPKRATLWQLLEKYRQQKKLMGQR